MIELNLAHTKIDQTLFEGGVIGTSIDRVSFLQLEVIDWYKVSITQDD
jgi:hypothetical protein